MVIINKRQEDILKELNEKGHVNVADLCETHNVSTVTIRKDLNFLENEKLLHRTHGGASKH
jgi:DeoR family transcriptional regulator of aga operon